MVDNRRGESNGIQRKGSAIQSMRWIGLALVLCATSFSWGAPREETALNYASTLWRVSDGLPEDIWLWVGGIVPRMIQLAARFIF